MFNKPGRNTFYLELVKVRFRET